ncbi:MAG: hypothetical protein ABEJ59_05660 [Halanaeroarchaeum sp.]
MTFDGPRSRRSLLRDLGVAGVATSGLAYLATGESVAMKQSTTVASDAGADLLVEWREEYNGAVLEEGATDPGPSVPVVGLEKVLPGDEGVVNFRVTAASVAEDLDGITVQMNAEATESSGVDTEPERRAGGGGSADLGDHVRARAWYDEGLFRDCTGTQSMTNAEVASGTLTEVVDALDGLLLETGDGACFAEGDGVCFALRWWIPDGGSADNAFQEDSVAFDLFFRARADC